MNYIKGIIVGIAALVLLTIATAYFSRNYLLQKVITKVETAAKSKNVVLHIDGARFVGLAAVELLQISVVPLQRDTLLRIHKLNASIKLLPLVLGRIQPDEVTLDGCLLNISRKDSLSNIDFLFPKDSTQKDSTVGSLNLAKLANNILNQLLYKVPEELRITNSMALLTDNDIWVKAQLVHCSIINHSLLATTILSQADDTTTVYTQGTIYAADKKIDVKFFGNNKPITIPYLPQKYQALIRFDTLSTSLNDVSYTNDLVLSGNWRVNNLLINHPKISPNDVAVSSASLDCSMFIGENYIGIDSTSTVFLKNVKVHPYIKYTLAPAKEYVLKMRMDDTPAQDFFDCFPTGLFQNLENLKVVGSVSYTLDFLLNSATPDSVIFRSALNSTDLTILSYGSTNLQKINGPFAYTPYEYGRPMRTFVVGIGNPNFTPFEQIAPFMRNAVITAEDGTFMWHKGFNEDAFRNAIVVNYKSGRFKKGASTITMQLVKNVFLNRNKNITRKLEEALIVWLIENNRLSSKQRMLEVYLNIIEWGPNVYGIGEAARFYFNKSPSQLSLGESLFLASIVPKPKAFKYSFTEDAQLKPHVRYFFKLVSGKMLRRGLATEADTVNLMASVQVTGRAKSMIVPSDSIPDFDELDTDDSDLLTSKINDGIRVFISSLSKDNPDGKTARDEERKRRQEERKRKKEEKQKQ